MTEPDQLNITVVLHWKKRVNRCGDVIYVLKLGIMDIATFYRPVGYEDTFVVKCSLDNVLPLEESNFKVETKEEAIKLCNQMADKIIERMKNYTVPK
jgi:hypothetical protein